LSYFLPEGRKSCVAKGVRKEKSKLAGSVELFSLIDLNVHKGHGEFAILTSAKMLKFYDKIMVDLPRMELAAFVLKKINSAAELSDNADFFKIVDQTFAAINDGYNLELIEAWFLFSLLRASGEQINLYRDTNGEKLSATERYEWDFVENALCKKESGRFGENEIKMMRLMISSNLGVVLKVKNAESMIGLILHVARALSKI